MLSKMSLKTFNEWVAVYSIEPFGEERADIRSAIVASVVANSNRGKNQKPFKIADFVPKFGPKKPQTAEEVISVVKTMSAAGKAASRINNAKKSDRKPSSKPHRKN